jgi:hypothetical protein
VAAETATVLVGWNPSKSAVAGYEFCYGRYSGDYDYVVDVGKTTSCSISGLKKGSTYYFAVKAYNSAGVKSALSKELKYTVPLTNNSTTKTAFDDPDASFVDNSDSDFTTTGKWQRSNNIAGFYGNDYRYARMGNGKLAASWTYTITQGEHKIYAQWTSHSNRAPDAPYSIYNNGKLIDTVHVDQRVNGGQLYLLGAFALRSGTLEIVLTNDASGYVVADCTEVVFQKAASAAAEVNSIDNSEHGFATTGKWRRSNNIAGFYGNDYQYARMGNGSLKASWTYNIARGKYEIYAQWTSHSNRAPDAPYSIYNNGKLIDTVFVDQRVNGGQLYPLGTFALRPGTLEIVLTNDASGYVTADATQIAFLN